GASAGSGSGSSSGSGLSGANPIPPVKGPATASIGIPSGTPAAGQIPQSPPDMIVYASPTPGDDAQIAERNRILAQLDLPHPEMIINAWITQISTSNPRALGDYGNKIRRIVQRYDDSVAGLVFDAYKRVSQQMSEGNYFNDAFYHYISDQFVAERSG